MERVDILGVRICATNLEAACDQIEEWIDLHESNYVCACAAHSIMECVQNPALYTLYNNNGMTVPDGMSVAWLLKLKGFWRAGRVAGTELMESVLARSLQRGWKHYFYGGSPEGITALKQQVENRFPGIQIVGTCSPPYRDLSYEEDEDVVARINSSSADIVWVAIGSPRQEQWMGTHAARLTVPVQVGVGAAFDFLSGQKLRAPRWMQKIGLEWLFRLLVEPGRLWPRYRKYPRFVVLVLSQLLGLQHPGSAGESAGPSSSVDS
ncbi:MAG: WecB/TagA/CpsF family glycosyltransferase [Anaerolineales bacterium]|nr:WecB/TagA/CpsF family glycosyltransferase [Anaerolineales bacterium]